MTWSARTKNDLIIEVWEKLDCESVGAAEVEAIATVVADQFGDAAVDSPMTMARLLADEGAELRHSEIMELYVARASNRPYDAALQNVLKTDDLKSAAATIARLENLRLKYKSDGNKEGVRLVRETALRGKRDAEAWAGRENSELRLKLINAEIAAWFTVWLQTPEVFEDWLALRQKSADYAEKFGA